MKGVNVENLIIQDLTLHTILKASDHSLLNEIREAGLSEAEALNAIQAVYQYLESNYPVLASISRQVLIGGTPGQAESSYDFWS